MNLLAECQTLSVGIERSPEEVYEFVAEPANLPKWSFFVASIRPEEDQWVVETLNGEVRIRFVPKNSFGLLDHWVTVGPDSVVYVPMRVVANGSGGSEFLFSVFRQPGMTDAAYEEDLRLVRNDLNNLKRVLERQAS